MPLTERQSGNYEAAEPNGNDALYGLYIVELHHRFGHVSRQRKPFHHGSTLGGLRVAQYKGHARHEGRRYRLRNPFELPRQDGEKVIAKKRNYLDRWICNGHGTKPKVQRAFLEQSQRSPPLRLISNEG